MMGVALFVVWMAVLIVVGIRDKRREARAWREGPTKIHAADSFTRIDPPARMVTGKRFAGTLRLQGEVTADELLTIQNRWAEARNFQLGGQRAPTPMEVAQMTDCTRLALVDVPRLLAHIRTLEGRK